MDRETAIDALIRLTIGDRLPLDAVTGALGVIRLAEAQQIAERIFDALDRQGYLVATLPTDRRATIMQAITDAIGNHDREPDKYHRGAWQIVSKRDWTGLPYAIRENLAYWRFLAE